MHACDGGEHERALVDAVLADAVCQRVPRKHHEVAHLARDEDYRLDEAAEAVSGHGCRVDPGGKLQHAEAFLHGLQCDAGVTQGQGSLLVLPSRGKCLAFLQHTRGPLRGQLASNASLDMSSLSQSTVLTPVLRKR